MQLSTRETILIYNVQTQGLGSVTFYTNNKNPLYTDQFKVNLKKRGNRNMIT